MIQIRSLHILFSIILFALTSCSISDELQYKGYQNFRVAGNLQDPQISVDVKLHNPNPIGAKLKKMDVSIVVNQGSVGSVCLDKPVKMKAREDFVLPFVLQTSQDQIQTLIKPGLQSLLFDQPLALQISGNITIRKFIFKKSYDFKYEDELNVSDIKLN